jgi:hypothetical protein
LSLPDDCPAQRLFVGVGNSAESLYYSLGSLPGPEIASLKLHVSVAAAS